MEEGQVRLFSTGQWFFESSGLEKERKRPTNGTQTKNHDCRVRTQGRTRDKKSPKSSRREPDGRDGGSDGEPPMGLSVPGGCGSTLDHIRQFPTGSVRHTRHAPSLTHPSSTFTLDYNLSRSLLSCPPTQYPTLDSLSQVKRSSRLQDDVLTLLRLKIYPGVGRPI